MLKRSTIARLERIKMTTPPGKQKRRTLRNLPPNCYAYNAGSCWYVFSGGGAIGHGPTRYKAIVAAHDFLQDQEEKACASTRQHAKLSTTSKYGSAKKAKP